MSSKILFFIPRDIPEEKDNPREKLSQKEKIIKKLNNINITENLLLKIEQISQSKKPLQNAKKDYWNILLAKITTQIDKFPSEGEAGFYLQKVFVINDLDKLLSSSKDLENWITTCHDSIPNGITSRCKTLQIPVEKINLLYNDVVLEYFKLDINNIKNNNDHTNNNNNNNSNNNNNYNNHIHNNNNNHQNNHDLDNNYNQEETYNQELDNLFSCEINSNLANYSYDYFSQGFDPINSYNYNNDHNNNNISQNITYDPNKNYNNNTNDNNNNNNNDNNNNHDLDNNYNQEETYNQEPDNILPCKINAILANYIFQNYTSDHFDPQAFDPINSYNYNNDHNNYNNNDHNNYNNNDHNNYNNDDHNNYNNNDHNNYNNDDHNFIHSQPRKMRKIDDITQLSIDEFYSKEILVVMNKEDTKSSIFYEKMSSTTGDFIVPAATPNVPPQCGALDRNATSL